MEVLRTVGTEEASVVESTGTAVDVLLAEFRESRIPKSNGHQSPKQME